ncbi:hypothetical protein LPJ79_004411 [Coemansia sp. RSA 1821]|nr:hypothetical protein LPJ68_004034 [Coemansia sp. RSA 1086]KAJ1748571.1 hypothetical protein LPJ79_004411 [Coemansia sp. RSA 1821]
MAPRQKHSSGPQMGSQAAQGIIRANLDFNVLNIHVLRRYRQAFKLNVKARSSKEDLVVAASRHFSSHMVDEVDTIARFLYTVHSNKGKSRLEDFSAASMY